MHIAIASTNPVKCAAVQHALGGVFSGAQFTALNVPSGVPDQPWGEEETRRGAYNRALAALRQTNADMGVGLEGGVIETDFGLMTTAWCAVIHREGVVGVGGGVNVLLPQAVAEAVRAGMELGTAMDQLVGSHNTKQKEGAIGILTDHLLNRQQAYEVIIQLAVAPFRRPDLYEVKI